MSNVTSAYLQFPLPKPLYRLQEPSDYLEVEKARRPDDETAGFAHNKIERAIALSTTRI
ncbi:hypothetical protein [Baaleninema simplex]|uniref:hypothetical protein n=1 Tax=Baaleninema simplex TaxID=2862350 RepID=UPI00130EB665|nr:hypothetical protein [Baaleninema simplex]